MKPCRFLKRAFVGDERGVEGQSDFRQAEMLVDDQAQGGQDTLNFRIVAEQVEDQLSLDTVREMGIDFAQGFFIARPQPLSVTPTAA